jgi:hypothetical protein
MLLEGLMNYSGYATEAEKAIAGWRKEKIPLKTREG